jgi:hypothetical protein
MATERLISINILYNNAIKANLQRDGDFGK